MCYRVFQFLKTSLITEQGYVFMSEVNKDGIDIERFLWSIREVFVSLLPQISGFLLIQMVFKTLINIELVNRGNSIYTLYIVLTNMGLFLLPVLVGVNLAKAFDGNVGNALILSLLIHPDLFENLQNTKNLDLIEVITRSEPSLLYIFIPVLTIYLMLILENVLESKVSTFCKKYFLPLIILVMMAPISVFLISPFGNLVYLNLMLIFEKIHLF